MDLRLLRPLESMLCSVSAAVSSQWFDFLPAAGERQVLPETRHLNSVVSVSSMELSFLSDICLEVKMRKRNGRLNHLLLELSKDY